MKKKWIAGLLALCMCLSTVGFVGCGDKNDTGDNGGNTEQGGNDTTTPEQDGDDATGDNENQEGENNGDTEQDGNDTTTPEQDGNDTTGDNENQEGGNNDDNQQDNENNQQGGDTTTGDTPPPDTPTPEPEITYVTVGDIVEEILGDIDVEADIQEVAEAIAATSSHSSYSIDKLIAVDGTTFYLDMKNNSTSNNYIIGLQLNASVDEYQNFYDYIKNTQNKVNGILSSKNLSVETQIEENSENYNELVSLLTNLETTYKIEKIAISSTVESNISVLNIFTPNILTADEMTELGIDDMNAFSYALLENKRGSGYDLVTGFTKDDVIETYVTKPNGTNIFLESACYITTISKNGIYKYLVGAYVGRNGSSLLHSKIINDSADVAVDDFNSEILTTFSENVILYDNGSRIN